MSLKAGIVAEHGESEAQSTQARQARATVRLAKLLRGIDTRAGAAHGDLEILDIAYDSRLVKPGTLFVAIRGEKTDGNKYVSEAANLGAVAIISEQENTGALPAEFPWIQVADARKALAISAANFYMRPAEVLKLIGVTGTNGKTTTSYLVDSILRTAGCEVGLLGTIGYRLVREALPAPNTTPESLDLQKYLAENEHA
jgi:UDP-N-acetylmuramoyl-L-alanyl-D-glutamate--2,6-diaminopimelate ligase